MLAFKFAARVTAVFLFTCFVAIFVAGEARRNPLASTLPEFALCRVRGLNPNQFDNTNAVTDCAENLDPPAGTVFDFNCEGNDGTACVTCGPPTRDAMVPFNDGLSIEENGSDDCTLHQIQYGQCVGKGKCGMLGNPQGNCAGSVTIWAAEAQQP